MNALHIVTRENDTLAAGVIARQRAAINEQAIVEVVDLTVPAPDYGDLLQKIFVADSVAVW